MKIGRMTWHAKQQLRDRYGLEELPAGPRTFICSESNNRKMYRIGEVYFIWSKRTKHVVTCLTEEMAVKTADFYRSKY